MTTEYALAKGQMIYTRRARLGKGEFHEFTAQIPYSFNTNDDYLNSKEIIDRAADDVVAVTMARLGLLVERPVPSLAPVAEVVKSFLETTEERTKARRAARKAEKAVAVEPEPEPVPDQYNEQPIAEVVDQDGLVVDTFDEVRIQATPELVEAVKAGHAEMAQQLKETAHQTAARHKAADPLLSGSGDAAGPGSEPSSEFDLDAELAAVPEEIDNDKMQATVTEWVRNNGGQRAVVELKKALMHFAPTITGIPQERRTEFLSLLPSLVAA